MKYAGAEEGVTNGGGRSPRLLDQVRAAVRIRHYSRRTEQAYVAWIKRFVLVNGKRHPREMGGREVEAFLTDLAIRHNVAAGTQNQALAALLFLYRDVLGVELPWMSDMVRAKRPRRIPAVLAREEVVRLLAVLDGQAWLMAALLYGTGMRLMECVRLRVKDVDFARNEITVRGGKGGKDRRVPLPRRLCESLQAAVERVRVLHARDLANGAGEVWLPHALARKYPGAAREPGWQYLFPAQNLSRDPRSGRQRRHHVDERAATCHQACAGAGGYRESGELPYPAPFLRHPFAGIGIGHPHRAGAVGSQGYFHHPDLYACAEPRRWRRAESAGSLTWEMP